MKTSDFNRFFSLDPKKGMVRTPEDLATEMISKFPEYIFESSTTTFLDPACGRGTFLEAVTKKLKSYGHSWENITSRIFGIDIDPFSGIKQAQYVFGSKNIIVHDFLDMNFPENWPKEFSIGVTNPPYSSKIDIKFISRIFDITTDQVIVVHPSTMYVDQKGAVEMHTEVKNKIEGKIKYLSIFNGNSTFGITQKAPCSIIHIDKFLKFPGFVFENKFDGSISNVHSLKEISYFGFDKRFNSFKDKIRKKIDSLENLHETSSLGKSTKNGFFAVSYSHIAGSTEKSDDSKRFYKSNFFIIAGRPSLKVVNRGETEYLLNWYFETENEAKNFIEYTKTDFARACLATMKINQHLGRGELRAVPYMDFNKKWEDLDLYNFFGIGEEEIKFIKEIIEPYY
jgi:hypothetical protein